MKKKKKESRGDEVYSSLTKRGFLPPGPELIPHQRSTLVKGSASHEHVLFRVVSCLNLPQLNSPSSIIDP